MNANCGDLNEVELRCDLIKQTKSRLQEFPLPKDRAQLNMRTFGDSWSWDASLQNRELLNSAGCPQWRIEFGLIVKTLAVDCCDRTRCGQILRKWPCVGRSSLVVTCSTMPIILEQSKPSYFVWNGITSMLGKISRQLQMKLSNKKNQSTCTSSWIALATSELLMHFSAGLLSLILTCSSTDNHKTTQFEGSPNTRRFRLCYLIDSDSSLLRLTQ